MSYVEPDSIMEKAQDYAEMAISQTQSFMERLAELAEIEFDIGNIELDTYTFSNRSEEVLQELRDIIPQPPTLPPSEITIPEPPEIVIAEMEDVEIPKLSAEPPNIEYPSKPTFTANEPPSMTSGFMEALQYPTQHSINIPTMPELSDTDITVPEPPDYESYPTINTIIPNIQEISTPSAIFEFEGFSSETVSSSSGGELEEKAKVESDSSCNRDFLDCFGNCLDIGDPLSTRGKLYFALPITPFHKRVIRSGP
ncbi:hypothetical protein MCHI_003470 [Candidatus Magnetoovum chiemensis]|nr:hypothetical protein MCHI_003470 [Candidatus Magnetoovum chiemensis]